MILNCAVIDDEPHALKLLEDYVKKVPFLSLKGSFYNPLKALSFLQQSEIDLIFIDINMPTLNGFQFLNSLKEKPLFVFITAYSEYAIESYSINAIDYLLKPVEFERFIQACNKALYQFSLENREAVDEATIKKDAYIKVKSGTKVYQLKISEILYVEASGNYLTIHTEKSKIMTLSNMNDFVKTLPNENFVRVHRSYIVSLSHISEFENHQLVISNKKIPISQSYKREFVERFFGDV